MSLIDINQFVFQMVRHSVRCCVRAVLDEFQAVCRLREVSIFSRNLVACVFVELV
jgi:hypothetical protein